MSKTKTLVLLALLVSQALILSIIEAWIPIPMIIPGVKLGLANIITIITLMFFGYREALLVVFVRCLLASLFGGSMIIFIFSVTGGILSTIIMWLMYKRKDIFSLSGVSVAGSITHNVGQMAVASMLMRDTSVLNYIPLLLISGIVMGFFIGICSDQLSKAIVKTGVLR